jgi:hypothetical protein
LGASANPETWMTVMVRLINNRMSRRNAIVSNVVESLGLKPCCWCCLLVLLLNKRRKSSILATRRGSQKQGNKPDVVRK